MKSISLTIRLEAAVVARLEDAAAAAALSVEDHAARIIAAALPVPGMAEDVAPFEGPDIRTEAAKRYQREQGEIALAQYRRTGVSYPLEEVLKTFDDALEVALARKR